MLKNARLYGSIIPNDVHSLRIRGLSLGEKIDLQILALTDHPVGRQDTGGGKDGDSGIGTGTVSTSAANDEKGKYRLAKEIILRESEI